VADDVRERGAAALELSMPFDEEKLIRGNDIMTLHVYTDVD
jgi:hypothetical protein